MSELLRLLHKDSGGQDTMQPLRAKATILKTFKDRNNWIRANKLLEDLDHFVIRSAGNIARSMTVLDKSTPDPDGYKS